MKVTKGSLKRAFFKAMGATAKGVHLMFGGILVTSNLMKREQREQFFTDVLSQ